MKEKDHKSSDEQQKRATEINQRDKNSFPDSDTRSMGNASGTRSEAWDNEIGVSREVGKRGNSSGSSFGDEVPGGTLSQLIAEAENQLAFLENSAEKTKKHIFYLKEMFNLIQALQKSDEEK